MSCSNIRCNSAIHNLPSWSSYILNYWLTIRICRLILISRGQGATIYIQYHFMITNINDNIYSYSFLHFKADRGEWQDGRVYEHTWSNVPECCSNAHSSEAQRHPTGKFLFVYNLSFHETILVMYQWYYCPRTAACPTVFIHVCTLLFKSLESVILFFYFFIERN